MIDATLREYIAAERARGVGDAALRSELVGKGWDAAAVDAVLTGKTPPPEPVPERPFDFETMFTGRLSLRQYAWNLVQLLILLFGAFFVIAALQKFVPYDGEMQLMLIGGAYLVALPFYLSLVARRLHDLDLSGWIVASFIFLPLAFIVPLLLLLAPGSVHENAHGARVADRGFLRTVLNT